MHQDESAVRFDHDSRFAPSGIVRRNVRADAGSTVPGDFSSDETDTPDVQIAMFP